MSQDTTPHHEDGATVQGCCEACGRQSQLSAYRRPWYGGGDRTSYLCSDCLDSVKKRPNLVDCIPWSSRKESSGRFVCVTEPFVKVEKPRKVKVAPPAKQDDRAPSLTVSVDGQVRIHAEGKSPSRPPSAAKLAQKMWYLVEDVRRRG